MLLAANLPILAETAQNGFQVSAGTVGKCTITTEAIAFGTLPTPIVNPNDALRYGSVHALCSLATKYRVALDLGKGDGATCATRKMKNNDGVSVGTIDYNIYLLGSGQPVFGDGVLCGQDSGELTGTGAVQAIEYVSKIMTPQNPGAGSFSDLVTATITF